MFVESVSGNRCKWKRNTLCYRLGRNLCLVHNLEQDSSGERHFADEDFNGPPIPMTMCGEAGVCLYGMQTKQRVPCTVCNL